MESWWVWGSRLCLVSWCLIPVDSLWCPELNWTLGPVSMKETGRSLGIFAQTGIYKEASFETVTSPGALWPLMALLEWWMAIASLIYQVKCFWHSQEGGTQAAGTPTIESEGTWLWLWGKEKEARVRLHPPQLLRAWRQVISAQLPLTSKKLETRFWYA